MLIPNLSILVFSLLLLLVNGGPVNRAESTTTPYPTPAGDEDPMAEEWGNLEYARYLSEVVNVIEGDPKLKVAFENVSQDDIQSGKVVDMIDFHEGVRSKLDEIKRREVERLRDAMQKLIEKEEYDKIKIPEHLDHANVDTFNKDDLKKLIKKTTNDLEAIDKKRRDEFKQYELKKEHDYKEKVKTAPNEEEKHKIEQEHEQQEKKHKEHEKLKHPGSKDQLEEVWEKGDHLDKDSFDMRTMFALHDLNGDGYLEPDELEALFQYELDKVYDKEASEDDMRERVEEENRMREHVQQEMDKNKDGFVSLDEWLAEEKEADFDKDEGWKTLDEEPVFTDDEFNEFEKQWDNAHPTPAPTPPPPPPQGQEQQGQAHAQPNAPPPPHN